MHDKYQGHTPGPWNTEPCIKGGFNIRDVSGNIIARVYRSGEDAALIASAPTLAVHPGGCTCSTCSFTNPAPALLARVERLEEFLRRIADRDDTLPGAWSMSHELVKLARAALASTE